MIRQVMITKTGKRDEELPFLFIGSNFSAKVVKMKHVKTG